MTVTKCQVSSTLPAPTRLVALSILSIVLAFGCGNDGGSGSNGTNGNGNGTGATNGSGATGGNGAALFSGAALCTVVFGPESVTGYVRLVSDEELDAGEPIDSTAGAIEVGGGVSCAVNDRSVFALNWESPTITRYDEVDGAFVEGPRVSFANFGLTSLASVAAQTQIVSETKAYFVDTSSAQLIVWNPRAMEAIESIPLEGFDPPEGQRQIVTRAGQIDGRLFLWSLYQNAEEILTSRTAFGFLDPETDEITIDTTDDCGALGDTWVSTSNGDTYFSSTTTAAMEHALGLPGSFEPCALRVRAGASELDPTYLEKLNGLTDLAPTPTGGVFDGGNDRSLLLAYNQDVEGALPIDGSMTARELASLPAWDFYEVVLGSGQPASRLEDLPTGSGRAGALVFDGKTFLTRRAPDFSSNELVDLSERPVKTAFVFSGSTVLLSRLGTEPDPRMARRIEPRGDLSLLSFSDSRN